MISDEPVDVVLVGAGFSGLYMLKRLLDMNMKVRAFETASDVGGTWYWNRYPGARCDLESVDYSYSFDPELEQEWEWSERYPAQPEIRRYLGHVADRYNLRRHFDFDTTVTAASFDDSAKLWTITTSTDEQVQAAFCIMATGILSVPKPPEIDGLESFGGNWYHTGRWPHEPVSFADQRVAVIGTGSSGVQVIPRIADEARRLTVFQRTPNYTVPGVNYPLTDEQRNEIRRDYPERRRKSKDSPYGLPFPVPTTKALDADPAEREEKWEHAWVDGHIVAHRLSYSDLITSEEANNTLATFLRKKIAIVFDDQEVAKKLQPHYPFGTKRPCLAADYYTTFNRDNVSLVDVVATPILRFNQSGIETTDRQYDVDSIVFATGFDAISGAALRIDIAGAHGRKLKEKWSNGPHALFGMATAGFPNLFFVMGPGSPTLGNFVLAIEQNVDWIADCLRFMREHAIVSIDASAEAEEAWVDHSQDIASQTLYPRTNSWYSGVNVPGKPRFFAPYLGGADKYREKCDEAAAAGYAGFFELQSDAVAAPVT